VANAVVNNSVAESINNRLTKVIQYQIEHSPGAGWESFLVDEHPAWGRIILSGVSQGAGMAAFIAKRERVARVVLFSGPWDYVEKPENLAPWIFESSETPKNLWYAEYHRRERNASAIANAYAALGIEADHVLIFDLDLPAGTGRSIDYDLYHISTVRLDRYSAQWKLLFGR
jgi:pimeloyl-ACP methyl ester carboxylesterase